jgi:hypothetical protein
VSLVISSYQLNFPFGVNIAKFLLVGERNRISAKPDNAAESAIQQSRSHGRPKLGRGARNRRVMPAEQGIAEMMVDLYRSFSRPLSRRNAVWVASDGDF